MSDPNCRFLTQLEIDELLKGQRRIIWGYWKPVPAPKSTYYQMSDAHAVTAKYPTFSYL